MNIDAHVHFWKYSADQYPWIDKSMKLLKQHYLPQNLQLTLSRNDIQGVVAIQAVDTTVESRFLAELAQTHPLIKGVVGWVDFTGDRLQEDLEELKEYSVIKGFRHQLQAEKQDYFTHPKFLSGVAKLEQFNFTYDIVVKAYQLPWLHTLLEKNPNIRFVLDHCGKPDIANNELTEWRKSIEPLAQYPNLYCKLSGLFTEAKWKEWSASDFYPYLDTVFRSFGTDRLLFGSDWPVMLLSGIYVQWKSLIEKYMENEPIEIKDRVFGLNAIDFYRL
ncbi:amidohydrolase family protein [Gynurincola endophyticus]|uniref:amidohydrolase family protein n=1 Tax=Gynurincola endophyticus TaxID=2479004 RepID=UPI000F8D54A3|nr:amidohydrolase family protein [Gynurincola endophyticus]